KLINECYLANKDKDLLQNIKKYYKNLIQNLDFQKGFISELYAPKDDDDIKKNERVFYTFKNALYLDTIRQKIENEIPKELRHFFIAPLIYEASVHSNTSGVFKGFYKGKDGIGKFG
ncbi:DNA modification methylase, partial [Campylobacter jejuni]|nr:DNA modification methylase [Campylobacter jejuni]